jgi:hypothetical protein
MPRDGAVTLSDIREPTLTIRLPDLLATLANCRMARSFSIHERCKAKFQGFSFRA